MGFKSPLDVLKQGIARAGAGPYDKEAVQKTVSDYTSGSKVVVFSWTRWVAIRLWLLALDPIDPRKKRAVGNMVEERRLFFFLVSVVVVCFQVRSVCFGREAGGRGEGVGGKEEGGSSTY